MARKQSIKAGGARTAPKAYGQTFSNKEFRDDVAAALSRARAEGSITIVDSKGSPRAVVCFPDPPNFDE